MGLLIAFYGGTYFLTLLNGQYYQPDGEFYRGRFDIFDFDLIKQRVGDYDKADSNPNLGSL